MIRFPQISLLYVAALTPPEHEVHIVDDDTDALDPSQHWDLAGITCMTATAPRAYEIAAELRRQGTKVVLGGVHPSVMPDEARKHCDAIVIGEAEPVWGKLLSDAAAGRLEPVYRCEPGWNLDDYPLPARGVGLPGSVLGVVPVVTSRGCPFACDFCCVRNVFGRVIRHVSVDRVLQDIQRAGSSRVMFLDDNIVGDQAYASRLFQALKGQHIQWVGQASISFVHNTRLLEQAADSGCRGLFMGLETVSEERLSRMTKSMRALSETAEAIRRIRESGILLHASIIFGFDDDGPSIFDETLDFLQRTRVPSATFNILTPYPGTVLHDQLAAEGRLLTYDWDFYDHCTPVYIPRRLTPDQLYEGYSRVKRSFFSTASIAQRLPANWRTPLLFLLANVGLRLSLREERDLMKSRTALLGLTAPRGLPA